ncbi:MAG TPA: DUF6452 family protein [Bacteroidales bacterium]|nr:DUF6452 family protein [Bacteroidales bacterium]
MKKLSIKQYIFILLTGIIAFLESCTPESCLDDTESFLEASFYNYKTKNVQVPDSITIYGVGRDTSKVYSSALAIKVASLPLNPASTSSAFVVRINGISDTLSISHFSYPHLISKECGYTYYHEIYPDSLTFTKNTIDSIWIKNRIITTLDEENIRIFY